MNNNFGVWLIQLQHTDSKALLSQVLSVESQSGREQRFVSQGVYDRLMLNTAYNTAVQTLPEIMAYHPHHK